MRILILENDKVTPVGWWRCYGPLQMMRKLYPDLSFDYRKEVGLGEMMAYDAFIVFRPNSSKELQAMSAAKKIGLPLVVDYDDDLLNVPGMHPLYAQYADRESIECVKAAALIADQIWVSTAPISKSLGRDDAIVIPNAIPPEWLPESPAPVNGSAGWRGREVQYMDVLFALMTGWYDRVKQVPKSWHWYGWQPFPSSPGTAHYLTKYTDTFSYLKAVRDAGINNLWKPLFELPFNDSKSNISWIEATMGGGACITNYAGKPGWENALPEFTFDEAEISGAFFASKKAIERDYNLEKTARRRYNALKKLIG